MKKFFENIKTLEELKKEYKKLAFKFHPDINQDANATLIFQNVNNEYNKIFEVLKLKAQNEEKSDNSKKMNVNETPEEFKDIINQIIHLQNIEIEIIGTWVWVSGETKQHKDIFKKLGFNWCSKKEGQPWAWHTGEFKKYGKKSNTMAQIREKYGSTKIGKGNAKQQIA